ncbi:TonB-dependent receptor domain-containing protein [candidate division KSB1 bacterium]
MVKCKNGYYLNFAAIVIMFTIVSLLCTAALPSGVSAQQNRGNIVGKVTDEATGAPLGNTNVYLKNERWGTASSNDGTYRIANVPVGTYTLISAYIGYYTEEVEVVVRSGQDVTVNFSMRVSALSQDEIIVTGTGYELRKKEMSSAISTLNMSQIEATPVENVSQLLIGQVTGGSVNLNTASPGTGARMRLRGITSAAVSQTPVIYIDGVRVDNNTNWRLSQGSGGLESSALSDIMIADIERIEVTKGGAAATLYGSEAASGVIQIFTKKGSAGAPRWQFRFDQGFNQPEKKFVIEDFAKDHYLETGYFQKYQLGVEGGTESVTYHLNGYILESGGIQPKNDDRVYSFRGGLRTWPTEKLQVDFSAGYVRDNYDRVFNNNALAAPFGAIEGGEPGLDPTTPLADRLTWLNEEWLAPDLKEYVNRFTFATNIQYDPYDFLTNKFTAGFDYRKNEARYFVPIVAQDIASTTGGGLFRSDREYMTITLDYAGTVKYSPIDWMTSNFTFGIQAFREEDRELSVDGEEFGLPGTDDFDNTANLSPLESNRQIYSGGYYFNEQLGIKDKLFLNAGLRVDGNTAFGDEVDFAAYPKLGVAYNISDEEFWRNSGIDGFVNQMKLRSSWGKTGSFPPPFEKDKTFAQGSYLGGVSVAFDNPGDVDLGPEVTSTIEFGFDGAFWDERIGVEFTYFTEKTEDALMFVPSDPSTGLGSQMRNIGEIENKGIELGIDAMILNTNTLKLSVSGSFSTLDNKVTSLGGAQAFSVGGFGFLPQRVDEGYPVGSYRVNVPTGGGVYDANVLQGSPIADKYYTLGIRATIKNNLYLRMLGDGQTGGYILNTGSVIRYFNGMEPQASKVPAGYSFSSASAVFIEDASFFKIREISASYDIPKKFQGVGVTAHFGIRNVYIFADNTDLDPELHGWSSGDDFEPGGINFFTLSPPRTFRFGLQFKF